MDKFANATVPETDEKESIETLNENIETETVTETVSDEAIETEMSETDEFASAYDENEFETESDDKSKRKTAVKVAAIVGGGAAAMVGIIMAVVFAVGGDMEDVFKPPKTVEVTTVDFENPPDFNDGGERDNQDGKKGPTVLNGLILDGNGKPIDPSNVATDASGNTYIIGGGTTQYVSGGDTTVPPDDNTDPPPPPPSGENGEPPPPPPPTDRCVNPNIKVSLNGSGATSDCPCGKCVLVTEGSRVSIKTPGTYTLSGTLTNAYVEIQSSNYDLRGHYTLILNGVNITNNGSGVQPPLRIRRAEGSSEALLTPEQIAAGVSTPIEGESAKIIVNPGTVNKLNDVRPKKPETVYGEGGEVLEQNEDPNASLFCRIPLTIEGTGSLEVIGGFNHGINSREDLIIDGTKITIQASAIGIRSRLWTIANNANLTITSGGKGMRAAGDNNGYITLNATTIVTASGYDAIHAATDLTLTSCTINVLVGGGYAGMPEIGSSKCGLRAGGNEYLDPRFGNITVTGSRIEINSTEAAVNSSNRVVMTGSIVDVTTMKWGIRARGNEELLTTTATADTSVELYDTYLNVNLADYGIRAPLYVKIQGGGYDAHVKQGALHTLTPPEGYITITITSNICAPGHH